HRGHLTQSFNQHDQLATSIAVGPESDPGDLVFRLPPEASVSGAITDESGDPVQRAEVVLFSILVAAGSQNILKRAQGMTDDDGQYHFAHLPAGKYMLAVSAKPWYALEIVQNLEQTRTGQRFVHTHMQSEMFSTSSTSDQAQLDKGSNPLDVAYPLTFYRDTSDPAQAVPIQLTQGERAIANVTLHPAPAVHIRVKIGEPDDPYQDHQQSRVLVQQRRADGSLIPGEGRTPTHTSGVLEVSGVVPGRYVLETSYFGENRTKAPSSQEITVSSNGEIEKNQLPQAVPVAATVQFDAVAAPKNLSIQLLNRKANQVFREQITPDRRVEFRSVLP